MKSSTKPRRKGFSPTTKDVLRGLEVRPSKERGQNFLIQTEIPEEIVRFGDVPDGAHVVEIGPGTGAMTTHLAHFEHLTLIEIEPRFCELLKDKFPRAEIRNEDVRKVDLSSIGSSLYVFGNIPYVFSTDIVFHLLACRAAVKQAVLMVQREFAERLAAPPGGRDYGSISVSVQLWCDVELGPVVPGDSFHPPTKVESQVMKLTFLDAPRVNVRDAAHFETVVRAAFSQRRKKLINSLLSRGRWDKARLEEAIKSASLSPDIRAEKLSIEEFSRLADALAPGAS